MIYCGSSAGPLHFTGPLFMCFFAEPQNPTGIQCISRIDLRARRRSAVDPQTNTCETVVPQDSNWPAVDPQNTTGMQLIRQIDLRPGPQSILSRSANKHLKNSGSEDPTGPQSIRKIQRACCRSAICPRRILCICRFQYAVQMLRHPAVTQQHQKLQQLFAGLIQPTRDRAALVGPQIRTAFCRDPLKPTNKRHLSPNYSMMQRNEILFWRQSIAKKITIHIILPFHNDVALRRVYC